MEKEAGQWERRAGKQTNKQTLTHQCERDLDKTMRPSFFPPDSLVSLQFRLTNVQQSFQVQKIKKYKNIKKIK